MTITVGELNAIVSKLAPPSVAEPWDNVGLQVGDPESIVKKSVVALEISSRTIEEAAACGATAIICHHPLIFHPIKSLREDKYGNFMLARLIRSRIALIVAHTNLDKSEPGPNYALANALGIQVEKWLRPDSRQEFVKLLIFTPEGHEAAMIEAIARGGGGGIGNYSHCTFRSRGTGTFKPLEGANPFIGDVGRMEETEEWRIESLVPRKALANVLREVRAAHPYEEPALDVVPVEIALSSSGLGIIGSLPGEIGLSEWQKAVDAAIRPLLPKSSQSQWEGCRIITGSSRSIQRIAICSGSGGSLIADAADVGVDCLLTGEIDHHDAIMARERDLPVVCLGHFASEAAAMPYFADALRTEAPSLEFVVSQSDADPMASLA